MAHAVSRFVSLTDKVRFILGPAARLDASTPVVHRHDAFEQASEEELSHFIVETDSVGHHYAVRREDLNSQS